VSITATLLGQMLTFAVLVWFINQFLWSPLIQVMSDRSKRIADGLSASERGKHELELAEKRAAERLREAKQQAADIIARANKRATEIVEEAKETGHAEGQRQLEAARMEITQESNRAKEHLRTQLGALVMVGVEKILEREVDANSHSDFVAKLAEKL